MMCKTCQVRNREMYTFDIKDKQWKFNNIIYIPCIYIYQCIYIYSHRQSDLTIMWSSIG